MSIQTFFFGDVRIDDYDASRRIAVLEIKPGLLMRFAYWVRGGRAPERFHVFAHGTIEFSGGTSWWVEGRLVRNERVIAMLDRAMRWSVDEAA